MPTPTQPVTLYRMAFPTHDCPWGKKAVTLLSQKGIPFQDIKLTNQQAVDDFKAKHQVTTTPQIFFGDERIGGYTDLAKYFDTTADTSESSYIPVIAVFAVAALITLAVGQRFMGFMGMALCLLAMLKLMDIPSFIQGFKRYDLVTPKFAYYGWAYPFIELLLGLAFLTHKGLIIAGPISLVVGIIGALSVYKAVYVDKLELNCACIGGNSKAPLGLVSMLENGMMIVMGVMLIFNI